MNYLIDAITVINYSLIIIHYVLGVDNEVSVVAFRLITFETQKNAIYIKSYNCLLTYFLIIRVKL